MHLMTKVISLSDEAYTCLKSLKKEGESFSDVVNRIASTEKKKSLLELAGKWPGGNQELETIKRTIYEDRKKFKLRKVGF
ncbi:antitoxin VapB family protein [Candidatus Woesearchaeota archaeon]|nr:antitoxin VapB family protein [Candidatus Woesearchaeota archaeon]